MANPENQILRVDKNFAKLIKSCQFQQITFQIGLPKCDYMPWLKPLTGKNLNLIIQDTEFPNEHYYDITYKTHKCANLSIRSPDRQDTRHLKKLMCLP